MNVSRRGRKWIVALTIGAGVLAVAAVFVTAGADSFGCRLTSVDKQEYVRANAAVVADVPVYPGAQAAATWNFGQTSSHACLPIENGPPFGGFLTVYRYKLPAGVSSDTVIDFYDRALLPRWEQQVVRAKDYPTCEVSYRKGDASLAISACSGSLWLKVDHDPFG